MDFKKSKTYTNLAKAFAGECQARVRYEFLVKHVVGENVIGKADDGVWYLLDCGASVVNLPDGLNDEPYVITKKYFCSDDVISEITLSKDLDKIGANAFTQSGLTKITANAGSDELVIEDGVFTELTTLTNVDFASRTMTEIKANAFKGCISLKTVALNNNVTTLGTSAFDGCVALETINVPTQVETIGELAFNGCALIANINMQNCIHLLRIENKTFYGCTGLQNIDFSDALTSIGSEAFSGCSSLVVVDWSNGLKTIVLCV